MYHTKLQKVTITYAKVMCFIASEHRKRIEKGMLHESKQLRTTSPFIFVVCRLQQRQIFGALLLIDAEGVHRSICRNPETLNKALDAS